jgi:hypothetical protein
VSSEVFKRQKIYLAKTTTTVSQQLISLRSIVNNLYGAISIMMMMCIMIMMWSSCYFIRRIASGKQCSLNIPVPGLVLLCWHLDVHGTGSGDGGDGGDGANRRGYFDEYLQECERINLKQVYVFLSLFSLVGLNFTKQFVNIHISNLLQ